MLKRGTSLICVCALTTLLCPSPKVFAATGTLYTYADPIDAVSIGVLTDSIDLTVRGYANGMWTAPYTLVLEKEFDPLLRESNLVLFPTPVTMVRVEGASHDFVLHPIRISHAPLSYHVAATTYTSQPRIYSREDWGADESFLFTSKPTTRSDEPTNREVLQTGEPSGRVKDCEDDQNKYPSEFKVEQTVTSYEGKKLRWPRTYSPKVVQLVVHHTAMETQNDARTGVEKIRALYDYHANNRGWGDIGYHYLIDDDGKIYEGKSGGDNVVGGHAYCNNIGTVGIALLGNFDMEQPTIAQTTSLKWLLDMLATKYSIDPDGTLQRHGKRMPTIVGHGDLLATDCPGYYMKAAMGQVRTQVASKDFNGRIIFPSLIARERSDNTESRLKTRLQERGLTVDSLVLQPLGSTIITSRPGGVVRTMVQFNARKLYNGLERIAAVSRSSDRMGIWQESGGNSVRVRQELIIPERLKPGDSLQIPLRFQMPREPGKYTVDIGDITYVFTSEGRRVPQPKTAPTKQTFSIEDRVNVQTAGYRRARARTRLGVTSVTTTSIVPTGATIRIRLGFSGDHVNVDTGNGVYTMQKNASACELRSGPELLQSGTVRVDPGAAGLVAFTSWPTTYNTFRGAIECRVIDGQLALINELSLDDYMAGLGEEPDTEPIEKQKAFAIAARSYAAFYIAAQGSSRKFPGMPYDGSDSPASFQLYKGYNFEKQNPAWARAVRDTAGNVLTKDGNIVKAAYFSSDDGRTRSPTENGWKNFPFETVFTSKDDPWCSGLPLRGHGVGMSGCGALGQAKEGKSFSQILQYYYPGTEIAQY